MIFGVSLCNVSPKSATTRRKMRYSKIQLPSRYGLWRLPSVFYCFQPVNCVKKSPSAAIRGVSSVENVSRVWDINDGAYSRERDHPALFVRRTILFFFFLYYLNISHHRCSFRNNNSLKGAGCLPFSQNVSASLYFVRSGILGGIALLEAVNTAVILLVRLPLAGYRVVDAFGYNVRAFVLERQKRPSGRTENCRNTHFCVLESWRSCPPTSVLKLSDTELHRALR